MYSLTLFERKLVSIKNVRMHAINSGWGRHKEKVPGRHMVLRESVFILSLTWIKLIDIIL